MKPVDILITYCEEKSLYPDYIKYMAEEVSKGIQKKGNLQAFGPERTRNWDNLKYWFRGVEQNCPWVRNIFLVVANEKHIPKWLNTLNPKLKIIFHRDFIPEEYLPTYNIRVIELFEHRIKDLSDRFIYCDDDFFFLNPIPQDLFFDDSGNIKQDIQLRRPPFTYDTSNVFKQTLVNTYKFCQKYLQQPQNMWFKLSHLPEPRVKKQEELLFSKFQKEFETSLNISKFRHPSNLVPLLIFLNYSKYELFKERKNYTPYLQSAFSNVDQNTDYSKYDKCQMACFNDSERCLDFKKAKDKLLNFLIDKFPKKSSFELY